MMIRVSIAGSAHVTTFEKFRADNQAEPDNDPFTPEEWQQIEAELELTGEFRTTGQTGIPIHLEVMPKVLV